MIMKHKFHSKDIDNNTWMIWCPVEQTSFCTILWKQRSTPYQQCPHCKNNIKDNVDETLLQKNIKRFGHKTDRDFLKNQMTFEEFNDEHK